MRRPTALSQVLILVREGWGQTRGDGERDEGRAQGFARRPPGISTAQEPSPFPDTTAEHRGRRGRGNAADKHTEYRVR